MQWTFWCFLLLVCVLGIHAFTIPHHDSSSTQNGTGNDASLSKPLRAKNLTSSVISSGRHRRYIILARSNLRDNITEECSSSSDDFPSIFTSAQVENGAIVAVFLIGIYCFTLLALICDKYFLPCVEKICEALNLSQDVAAATFMSVATSTPELFVNIIGTFITESDIGIGTVVGSSLFNSLGVASLGGLAASSPIQLHWWPVTRDVIIYIFAIVLLVVITWDGVIYWYEGLILFIVYFLYFTVMFQNVRICKFVKRIFKRNKVNDVVEKKSSVSSNIKDNSNNKETSENKDIHIINEKESSETTAAAPQRRASVAVVSAYGSYMEEPRSKFVDAKVLDETDSKIDEETSLFSMPQGSIWKKLFFFYAWPLKLILFCTIPDPQKHPKFFPLTFIMCIFWIGTNSYVISWMIAIIGNMFHIPDAVLGLTFLAAGGCLPEAISITIMSRRGEGSMGVSNSLGANTMNILVSLGMPWFLKTITMGTNDSAFILINSGSIEYTISALIFVAIALYLTFYFNKFKLSKTVGVILISIYLVCIVLAILAEMVFFEKAKCTPVPQGVRSHPLF